MNEQTYEAENKGETEDKIITVKLYTFMNDECVAVEETKVIRVEDIREDFDWTGYDEK